LPVAEFYLTTFPDVLVTNGSNFTYSTTAVSDPSATIVLDPLLNGNVFINVPGVYEVSWGCFGGVDISGGTTLMELFLDGFPLAYSTINGTDPAAPAAYYNWISASALVNVVSTPATLNLRNISGNTIRLTGSGDTVSYIIVKQVYYDLIP
jgi:hypothetical protein